jgi:hypothetical protein
MVRTERRRRRVVAETEFSIRFAGPALDDGRMAVRDLAPALLALGEMFQEAQSVVDPAGPPVTLEFQATEPGSFIVDLILVRPDVVAEAIDFFNSDPVQALLNLREAIIGAFGLFGIRKLIRGRDVVSEERSQEPGSVTLVLDDGTRLEVPAQTMELERRVRLRRLRRDVLRPLDSSGIEAMEISREDEIVIDLGRDDVQYYEVEADDGAPDLPPGHVDMTVTIVAPSFAEWNEWRVSDGERNFAVAVEDEGFLARVDRAEEAFRKGDRLRARFRYEQHETPAGQLRTEYTIERVLDHSMYVPPPTLELPPPEGD